MAITITAIPPLQEGRKTVGVKLSDNRTALLFADKISALSVGDDESKFILKEADGRDGGKVLYINPKPAPGAYRSGGGGGFKAAPKDEAAIVAQVILKEACDCARTEAMQSNKPIDLQRVEALGAAFTEVFLVAYGKVKGANGS